MTGSRGASGRSRLLRLAMVAPMLVVSAACSTLGGAQARSDASTAVTLSTDSIGGSTTVAPTTTTPTAAPGSMDPLTTVPITDDFEVVPPIWVACGRGECTDLIVPLDHARPDGETITLAVARLVATGGPEEYLGSLFVNPGGPGAEGTEFIRDIEAWIPESLRRHFDLVSWDTRGVEDSAALGCDHLVGDPPLRLVDLSDGITDELTEDRSQWDVVMACAAKRPVVNHLATVDTARDLDLLRRAVGDEQVSFVGLSHGSAVGWTYASLYPERVRAMVLDGAVAPPDPTDPHGLGQLRAIQATLERYDRGCAQAADCLVRDEGFLATIERLAEELEAEPIALGEGVFFGANDFLDVIIGSIYFEQEELGAYLSQMLAALDRGRVGPLLEFRDRASGGFEEVAFWSTLCADGYPPVDEQDYRRLSEEAVAIAPLLGRSRGSLFCQDFPGRRPGMIELDTTGAPTLLVIGSTGDAATPYSEAIRLDAALADSVLVTYDGGGHTTWYIEGCIGEIRVAYLVDLVVPDPGTVCPSVYSESDWHVRSD